MDFSDHIVRLVIRDAPRRVTIAGDALQFWWGADVGPQTAEGLVADHIAEVEAIVLAKLASGSVDPDGSIAITDEDLE
jgi:hypothetical protein